MPYPPIPLTAFAEQYANAPINWGPWREIDVPAQTRQDITPLMPTQDDLGEAPWFVLLVSFSSAQYNQGLIGIGVSDDGTTPLDEITHTWEQLGEQIDGIIVAGLRPLSDDGNNLDAILDWVAEQRVYLDNESLAQVTVQFGAFWPTLNWRS